MIFNLLDQHRYETASAGHTALILCVSFRQDFPNSFYARGEIRVAPGPEFAQDTDYQPLSTYLNFEVPTSDEKIKNYIIRK